MTSSRAAESWFGFYNIRKPPGPTSHDIVYKVRKLLPRRTKVGHAGTLDPFADGVLVVCVGPATRLADRVQDGAKRYLAQVTLGKTSTTDDTEGEVTPTPGAVAPSLDAVQAALRGFVGEIQQAPPAHSAVWIDGRRAYDLARKGEQVEMAPRGVTIHSLAVVRYEYPLLEIDVACGSGTYIRSLARDVGAALGVGGYCTALTRTAVGQFTIEQAVTLDELDLARDLQPPLLAVADLPRAVLRDEQAADLLLGRFVRPQQALPPADEAIAVDGNGRLLALGGIRHDGVFQPSKVFAKKE